MGRVLFFVGLAALMWVAWAISRRKNRLDNEERRELADLRREKAEREGRSAHAVGEPMARCDGCGTYFPKRDGFRKDERIFCSRACRDAADRR